MKIGSDNACVVQCHVNHDDSKGSTFFIMPSCDLDQLDSSSDEEDGTVRGVHIRLPSVRNGNL